MLFVVFIALWCGVVHQPPMAIAGPVTQFILTNRDYNKLIYDSLNASYWTDRFDVHCQTAFIIPGWKYSAFDAQMQTLAEAYNANETTCFNTVRVDWPEGLDESFAIAANALRRVAEEVATFARRLQKNGLLVSAEVVGFSLGAHMAGLTGRHLKTYLGQPELISEIIALDPAGPGFTDLFMPYAVDRLQPTDARHVVVLMTNAGCSGTSQRLGTINFVANNGRDQTGCARSDCSCSHRRALDLFTESLNTDRFVATSTDYLYRTIFTRGIASTTLPGDYYFQTNAVSPFARG